VGEAGEDRKMRGDVVGTVVDQARDGFLELLRRDGDRVGVEDPRDLHDVLLITGPVTTRMVEPLKRAYEAMPEPRLVALVRTARRSARIFPRPIHIIVNPATMDARNSWRCVRVEET